MNNNIKALIPGSFDPVTSGHENIIRRTAAMFGEVFVAIMTNCEKRPFFTEEERRNLCVTVFRDCPTVHIVVSDGLISELAAKLGCSVIVKGIRNSTDFNYEYELSQIYRGMKPPLETVFLPAHSEFLHVSSTAVREISRLGGDVREYVPECIYGEVIKKCGISAGK